MRILSIDGGGIRGLIPALVLAEIEARTGRRIAELFDLVAGTSTGGILACALTMPAADGSGAPRYRAVELASLYVEEGGDIFHRSLLKRVASADGLLDERYDDDGLMRALRKYFGDARLRDALVPVMVTAYEIGRRDAFFFRSARAREDPAYDFSLVEVTRSTSAAPTYFEPFQATAAGGGPAYALVDGGVFATNPAMCAYADAIAAEPVELAVSLGTGQLTRPLDYRKVRSWGQLEWARPVIDVVFDGVADTVDFQLGRLLGTENYVRLQTQLTRASDDLDDASDGNLAALREEAAALLRARDADVDALCARLTA
ncbi:MAG TPA: patatin-like phospholipase family protein [Solirubrobacteraceae bacterium]